eukprot:717857-Pleurochrysis_carterae.AAC.1
MRSMFCTEIAHRSIGRTLRFARPPPTGLIWDIEFYVEGQNIAMTLASFRTRHLFLFHSPSPGKDRCLSRSIGWSPWPLSWRPALPFGGIAGGSPPPPKRSWPRAPQS